MDRTPLMALPVGGTKAETLERLRPIVTSAIVLPLACWTVERWARDRTAVVRAVLDRFGAIPLIVRSSARSEDGADASQAGRFLSRSGVRGAAALSEAVDAVIASYGPGARPDDEVFVQPQLTAVTLSGVAFTHDPNALAPYRVINYARGGDTAQITGGRAGHTYIRATGAPTPAPPELQGVCRLLDELEGLGDGRPLDVEFAVEAGRVYLLQVRPLVLAGPPAPVEAHTARLARIERKVAAGLGPHPFLHGRRTVYGVMPDWNPAEIIGIRPRPLALSLYRELITDAIWAYQRNNYGYRNLRSFPLMVHFDGLPYIDVRVSFNSFIPRDLDGGLADRLVDHYIDRLLERPHLHDKVEFEIVQSCYALDLPSRLDALRAAGFTAADCAGLADALRRLTNRVIHPQTGLWRSDRERLDVLDARRTRLYAGTDDRLARIYWLLEDCKRYGTLPFAGLARAGFIAVQLLRSLVTVGVLSDADQDAFMNSLNTVSRQLPRDRRTLSRSAFLDRYGHLRPGTYDLLSPRYDEAPETYFDWTAHAEAPEHSSPVFAPSASQVREIEALLQTHGLESDAAGLLEFIRAGIELREYSKFVFTRNLSDALTCIREYAGARGVSPDDASYLDVHAFYELYSSAADPASVLADSVARGRRQHADTCCTVLPPLMTEASQVWAFHVPDSQPTFITRKHVSAPVAGPGDRRVLEGRIVCIPSADPGFDWLFSCRIAGLVTAYGGANSHMAIRANELGLPSVIGAGETLFAVWSRARRLAMDCAGQRVEVIE